MNNCKILNTNKFHQIIYDYVRYITNPKMKLRTTILNISDNNVISYATKCLQNGQVIAVPTDTIYGLACDANCPNAIQRLYSIKGRDLKKPLAICVSNLENLRYWGEANHLCDELLKRLLPGPFTIVLNKTINLNNPYLNKGLEKIGIRIPNYKFIQNLCENFQQPLALTSANKSNELSSLCIKEFKILWPHLAAVFNDDKMKLNSNENETSREGSTVIDLSIPGKCKILRNGIAYLETINIMKEFNILIE